MSLDLDPIKARADAATEGPWGVEDARVFGDDGRTQVCTLSGTRAWLPDAEFIAHARQDIPALLAEVEVLRHQLSHVEVDRDHYKNQSAEVERLQAIVDRVRELHPYEVIDLHESHGEEAWCPECQFHHPCQTIRALEGK